MTNSLAAKIIFPLCFFSLFFFASQTMAAQSSADKTRTPDLTVNESTIAKDQKNAGEDSVIKQKADILAKALRVPLGGDFRAFFSLEPPPRGIETVREGLESKTIYRAVFGINIPL